MSEYYFEICITPNYFYDIFMSEILDFTNEAIEECINSDGKPCIVVRTQRDIESCLISHLQNLSKNLSDINAINVNFIHTITTKKNQDYIKMYKDSITPIECGRFYIHPSWFDGLDSKINIILEPSLAFGTGHHSSTFMCIEALQQLNISPSSTLLDVGCGSGILALCANKLGANVYMCDIDELAINETKKNFLKNNATISGIWLGCIDDHKQHRQYDIVVANIVASVIIKEASKLISSLNDNAYLILSGILSEYAALVKESFNNLTLIEEKIKDEWTCLVLQRKICNVKGI